MRWRGKHRLVGIPGWSGRLLNPKEEATNWSGYFVTGLGAMQMNETVLTLDTIRGCLLV